MFDIEKYMLEMYGLTMGEITELVFDFPTEGAVSCTIHTGKGKVGVEVHEDVVKALSKWWGDQRDLRRRLLEDRVLDALGSLNQMAEGDVIAAMERVEDKLYTLGNRRFVA